MVYGYGGENEKMADKIEEGYGGDLQQSMKARMDELAQQQGQKNRPAQQVQQENEQEL